MDKYIVVCSYNGILVNSVNKNKNYNNSTSNTKKEQTVDPCKKMNESQKCTYILYDSVYMKF